jgi:hypothetical protein
MEKLIYLLLTVFMSINIIAQSKKNFKSFYKDYKRERSIVALSAPIGLANIFIDSDEKELKKMIKKGKKVQILIMDEMTEEINSDIKSYLPDDKYQEYMSIKEGSSLIELIARNTSDSISEIIVFIRDKNSLIAMGIYGNFSYTDLKKLSKSINCKS